MKNIQFVPFIFFSEATRPPSANRWVPLEQELPWGDPLRFGADGTHGAPRTPGRAGEGAPPSAGAGDAAGAWKPVCYTRRVPPGAVRPALTRICFGISRASVDSLLPPGQSSP